MNMFLLYLFTMMDNIKQFFEVITAISWVLWSLVLFISATCCVVDGITEDGRKKARKLIVKLFAIFLPFAFSITLIYHLIPSTKQVAFVYIVGTMSQSKVIQGIGTKSLQIPDKAIEILTLKMDEYLGEMKKEAEKKISK